MHQNYIDAGYHLQASGDHHKPFKKPKHDSPLCGRYASDRGGLTIYFLPTGPSTLPELLLSFEDGLRLTVCCEDTAREYIKVNNATKEH